MQILYYAFISGLLFFGTIIDNQLFHLLKSVPYLIKRIEIFAAPNVYDVPKADKILDKSHKYSFGVKTPIEKPSDTPG